MSKKKGSINIVIIGHVDSGKSTTSGNLLKELGDVDKRTIEKFEKESKEMGKGSFKYAWVMDKLKNERERGITISARLEQLHTELRDVNIIDAPGHQDFVKNMITGASQADSAIVMISAAKGEFEAGISRNGQTKEHIMLAHTLGLKNLCFAVNKMDITIPPFDEGRFDEICTNILTFSKRLGYNKKHLDCVPISGFHGDNLFKLSERMSWYSGNTLLQVLDNFPTPKRPVDKPLRMTVSSSYNISGVGHVICGCVDEGVLKQGDRIVVMPSGATSEVKSVEAHHKKIEKAGPGENIGINVKNISRLQVGSGSVIGHVNNKPPKAVSEFEAQLINLKQKGEIKRNYAPVVHVHTASVCSKITDIKSVSDRRTGKLIEENPSCIGKDQSAVVVFQPSKPLVVERMKDCPSLGRFSVRDSKKTVAVGIIKSVKVIEKAK